MAHHPTVASVSVSSHQVTDKRIQTVTKPTVSLEVFADNSVWDATNNKFLIEGRDFDGRDIFRS